MYALGWGLSNHPGRPAAQPFRSLVSNSGTKLQKINHLFALRAHTIWSQRLPENCTICERRGLPTDAALTAFCDYYEQNSW